MSSLRGALVLPRLVPPEKRVERSFAFISSGIDELNRLCGGGIEEGTTTLITGPSGVGKTTLALQFAAGMANAGKRVAVYSFEEESEMILLRCQQVRIPVWDLLQKGFLVVQRVEPLLYTSRHFAEMVREEIFEKNTQGVVIDSASGYKLSMMGEEHLEEELYSLAKYITNFGRTVFLVNEVGQVTGDFEITGRSLSYLAEDIIFLIYLEVEGELRKAIGVLKKRIGDFEKTLREFVITRDGLRIGPPLLDLRGILRGVPQWVWEEGKENLL
ncbi:MAG: ATPase domain-containing protein [Candidatus Caldatribacteriaceae bacterium]